MRNFLISVVCFALVRVALAQPAHFEIKPSETQEALTVISNINRSSFAYQATALQRMLAEANYFSDRLKLPTPHPIQLDDVVYPTVFQGWYSMIKDTSFSYFSTNIPLEVRLHAIKIGASGVIETTNFSFSFKQGRLMDIERLSEHEVEYYANDLDKLIGQPSLINDSEAHELATKWLAAVDVDVPSLEKKYPPEVNRLRYLPKNSTNIIELPFYFVHWGWQYYSNADNSVSSSTPLVEVKILGTTKEFVELHTLDTSFSRRPLLLITNALELIRTPNPSVKRLQLHPTQTNSVGDS